MHNLRKYLFLDVHFSTTGKNIKLTFITQRQVSQQLNCRGACQISERLEKYKPESRGLETSRDLAVRRPPS